MKKSTLFTVTVAFISFLLVTISCQEEVPSEVPLASISKVIAKLNDANVFELDQNDNGSLSSKEFNGFEYGFSSKMAPGDILCEGSGISFAKCVQKQLDGGKKLLLYKSGNYYIAEEL
jgi:hypothetical protein